MTLMRLAHSTLTPKAEVDAQRAAEDENTIDDADEARELDMDPKAEVDTRRAAYDENY